MSYTVKVGDGKYEVTNDNGHLTTKRHGESWSAGDELVLGCGLILALVSRIEELETAKVIPERAAWLAIDEMANALVKECGITWDAAKLYARTIAEAFKVKGSKPELQRTSPAPVLGWRRIARSVEDGKLYVIEEGKGITHVGTVGDPDNGVLVKSSETSEFVCEGCTVSEVDTDGPGEEDGAWSPGWPDRSAPQGGEIKDGEIKDGRTPSNNDSKE